MSTTNDSTTSPVVNTKSFTVNGHNWALTLDAARPWPYRLICAKTGQNVGYRTADERDAAIAPWIAVEAALCDLEAIDSNAARRNQSSRQLADAQLKEWARGECERINAKLEVKR